MPYTGSKFLKKIPIMTGEEFVKLCFEEKENALAKYFAGDTETEVGEMIRTLVAGGTDRDTLYAMVSSLLNETYYSLLLALDGEASLNGVQMMYKVCDEDENLLNECGELESAAYEYFMESEE